MQALRNKNKAIKPQKKPKSPYLSPSPSPGAKVQLQEVKMQIQSVKITNTTKRERIEFYPILKAWWMRINTCRMRIKAKEEKEIRG